MIRLVDRAALPAPPERVWAWFAALDTHYLDWHPAHLMWRTLSGAPLTEGATVFADEWLGRFRFAGRMRITDVQPGRFFRWAMLGPYALVGVGGSFLLERAERGCELTAEVDMGWDMPVLGPLLDRVIGVIAPVAEVRRHMAEEGRNLARLLSGPVATDL